MNRHEIWLLAQNYQQRMRNEAERVRRLRLAHPGGGVPHRHALAVLGDLLISAGSRLRARYDRRGGMEYPACHLS